MADSTGTQPLTYRQEHFFASLNQENQIQQQRPVLMRGSTSSELLSSHALDGIFIYLFFLNRAGTNHALLQSVISTCEFFFEKFAFVGRPRNINHQREQTRQLLFRNQAVRVGHFASISRQLAAFHGRLGVECHGELAFKSAQPTPSVA